MHLHCLCPELGGREPAQTESHVAAVSLVPVQLAWRTERARMCLPARTADKAVLPFGGREI